MKALVTGGTGFLGRHLVAALRSDGWDVILLLRRETAAAAPAIVIDAPDWSPETLCGIIDDVRPDVVFHLAGANGPLPALVLYRSNAVLTADLCSAVVRSRARPALVLAGSAAEYGPVLDRDLPVRAGHPCRPVSAYGISKHAATLHALAAARAGRVLVVRIFNIIGSGMPVHLALPSFAGQILRALPGTPVQVGNLDVWRDFADVAWASRAMADLAAGGAHWGRIVNLCSGQPTSLRRLFDRTAAIVGKAVGTEIDTARLRADEIVSIYGDAEPLRAAGIAVETPDFERLLRDIVADAATAVNRRAEGGP